jgi:hypothetical protein
MFYKLPSAIIAFLTLNFAISSSSSLVFFASGKKNTNSL